MMAMMMMGDEGVGAKNQKSFVSRHVEISRTNSTAYDVNSYL
jgi:hypothetical protein